MIIKSVTDLNPRYQFILSYIQCSNKLATTLTRENRPVYSKANLIKLFLLANGE
jgi:hypothetical protein